MKLGTQTTNLKPLKEVSSTFKQPNYLRLKL